VFLCRHKFPYQFSNVSQSNKQKVKISPRVCTQNMYKVVYLPFLGNLSVKVFPVKSICCVWIRTSFLVVFFPYVIAIVLKWFLGKIDWVTCCRWLSLTISKPFCIAKGYADLSDGICQMKDHLNCAFLRVVFLRNVCSCWRNLTAWLWAVNNLHTELHYYKMVIIQVLTHVADPVPETFSLIVIYFLHFV
jgi:hypothetical protein